LSHTPSSSLPQHWHRGRCLPCWHSSIQYLSPLSECSGTGLSSVIQVPDWFWHRHFCSFHTPFMSILLVMERDSPCMPLLLVVETDTPCTSILLMVERDTNLHVHTAGGGNGYTLHVHTAGIGKEYTLYVHNAGDGRHSPCTPIYCWW
jgi:hypothetical protein